MGPKMNVTMRFGDKKKIVTFARFCEIAEIPILEQVRVEKALTKGREVIVKMENKYWSATRSY
jgi:hypothetical protein